MTDEIEGKSFRWLFDTSADALLIVDRDGRIVLANPVAETTFGYSRAQFGTLHVEDLIPTRFRTRHHQLRAAFFNDPTPRVMTNALKAHAVRADGAEFAVDIKLAPIGTGQVMVSVHDASARHRAEQALRASEEQLRLLFAGLRDHAIVMLDAAGNIVAWNEGAQRLNGYAADEIIGHHFSVFFPPDEITAGRPQQILAATRRDGRHEERGMRQRKDGTRFFAQVTISALYDEQGELRGYGMITRDVTAEHQAQQELEDHRRRLEDMVSRRTAQLERQTELLRAANAKLSRDVTEKARAEQALRDSEERFRLLLESAGEGIYGVDTEGRCTFINGAALAQLGRTHEELIGCDMHALIHHHRADGTAYPAAECALYDAYRRGVTSRRVTETVWRKDGSSFLAEFSVQPLRRDKTVVGAVFVFRDVTHQQALTHRLAHQATHDALTGLVNRSEFERRLERAITDARRGGEHALGYIDLDHFKEINDSCGHAAGDQLLREITQRLLTRLRSRDTLARLGGDEFGVLLEHCPLHRALEIANDLRDALNDYRFEWNGRPFSVGLSLGLVPLRPGSGDMPELLNKADAACYAAKQKGRGCVHVAGSVF